MIAAAAATVITLLGAVSFGPIFQAYGKLLANPLCEDFEDLIARLRGQRKDRYRAFLWIGLGCLDRCFGPPKGASRPPWTTAWLTATSFDRCLVLAVLYPLTFAFLSWTVTGTAGSLGDALGLKDTTAALNRLVSVGFLSILVSLFVVSRRLPGWKSWVAGAFAFAFAFAFAVTGASAGAVAVAVAVTGAVAVAVTGAVAGAVAGAGAFAVAVAGAGAGAIAFPVAVAVAVAFTGVIVVLQSTAIRHAVYGPFLVLLWLLLLAAMFILNGTTPPSQSSLSVMLGLGLLPLLNAPFDWLSLAVTRTLLTASVTKKSPGHTVLYSGLDFLLATLLLLLLAATLVVGVEFFNATLAWGGNKPVLDLAQQLAELRDPTEGGTLWIALMLFSTYLPTLAHLIIALASLAPEGLRFRGKTLADALEEDATRPRESKGALTQARHQFWLTFGWVLATALALISIAFILFVFVYSTTWAGWLLDTVIAFQGAVHGWFQPSP
ncbi:hypothetical protein [Rhodospirillum sp. A1_3_36]|uniref:hypothetical protein n=1 Tax=Rhodospirillum sp. A1_3_36 TaxID=3391666 RepID=UPI0039A4CEE4